MRSTAEILEGNKVKLSVEVDEDELQTAVEDTFRRLQREVSVPGFRPGKVPRRLLEVRMGGKAIREEVIRHALPDYYAQAVEEAALDMIAAPEIDITSGEEEGPLAFDAVVEVRPKVSVAGRDGLVVTVPSPEVSEEDLDAQIDRMREQFAELSDVDRPAADGDVVTVDVQATRDGEPVEDLATSDFVYEVGTGMLAEGADEQLRGAKPGDILRIDAMDAPGGSAQLKILVKQVREKVLPEADDAWASDASEFDTIAELRSDLSKRMTALRTLQAPSAPCASKPSRRSPASCRRTCPRRSSTRPPSGCSPRSSASSNRARSASTSISRRVSRMPSSSSPSCVRRRPSRSRLTSPCGPLPTPRASRSSDDELAAEIAALGGRIQPLGAAMSPAR